MQKNKLLTLFLLCFFLGGITYISGQQSNSYRLTEGKLLSSTAQLSSSSFKLVESNLGVFCPGKAKNQYFQLNSGLNWTTAIDSSFLFFFEPTEFELLQNYPNPFNPTTTIQYNLPENTEVTIRIFNAAGQVIRTLSQGEQQPGVYKLDWDGKNDQGNWVASGIYYYQIQAADFKGTKKMLLVK